MRSTIGLAAGAARETAEFLVPQAFQSSKTYEIVVRNSLKFLVEDVGGVESQDDPNAQPMSDDYLARKAVGNFVDLAGMATLHLSPLWMLAIVSDVAYGTKSYVVELAEELQRQGLIDDASSIHHVDDVLDAIQRTSGTAATAFDTPPLSVEELRKSLNETRDAARSADLRRILPEAELRQYWTEMRDVANQENVSLLGVSAALTMHSLRKVQSVSRGALTGVSVAGGLLNRHVITHYVTSLAELQERGFYTTVSESSAPYIEAVWKNFAAERSTWTAEILSGRAFSKAARSVSGWFSKRDKQSPSLPVANTAADPPAESAPTPPANAMKAPVTSADETPADSKARPPADHSNPENEQI